MLEIATWRYGIQYEISRHGCMSTEYSSSRNVTWLQWQLPQLYNFTANSVIAIYVLGLYVCLCLKYLCTSKWEFYIYKEGHTR